MTESPYKPPTARLAHDNANLRESDFLKAYISMAIASFVIGAVAGAVMGGLIGAVWTANGGAMDSSFTYTVSGFSFLFVSIINYFVFRFLVNRFIVRRLVPAIPG